MSNVPFGPPPVSGSRPMAVIPDPGVVGGSNLDAAPHEIPPGQGRYLQDVLLDVPGIVRQRGPVKGLGSGTNPDFPSLPANARVIGMTTLSDPNGTDSFRLLLLIQNKNTAAVQALIYGRTTTPAAQAFHARAFFEMMEPKDMNGNIVGDPFLYFDDRRSAFLNVGSLLTTLTIAGLTINNSDPDPFFQSSMALDGGALIGIGQSYGADLNRAAHRAMLRWRGAAKPDYATGGAVTIAGTQSSPAIVGVNTTFLTSVEPGMFLLDSVAGRCLGIVKSITDNTHLTLEQNLTNQTFAARTGDVFTSITRPFSRSGSIVSAGTITASTTSAVINGGGTKFVDQGLTALPVFRASDYAYIGLISTVQSNTQLTLTANALVPMASEKYVVAQVPVWGVGAEPVFSAYFSGMQLVAGADNLRNGFNERSRIFVTDVSNLEAIDVTKTGTFYDLPSTKPHTDIRGMFATESAALVFLAEATYGLFGNTPTTLTPRVVHNDGLLSPMTIQAWQGGAVWAGYKSIYWFDGATVRDLLAGKAAAAHQRALAQLDYGKLRAWSMLHNGHYICFLSKINPGIFTYTQGRQNTTIPGSVTFDPTSLIYSINLTSGAVTFWTNVAVRGYSAPPGKLVNIRDAYFVVESATTAGPIICSAEALFQEAGSTGFTADSVTTNPTVSPFSPHFFVEGRLNDFGDPERMKRAQTVLAQFSMYGGLTTSKLGMDLVHGIGRDTKALSARDRTSTDVANPIAWVNKRTRFSSKGTLLGVRFYTMADGVPAAPRVGPWSIGFKPMRPGRV